MIAVREGMRLTLLNDTFGVLRDEIQELELAIRELHPDAAAIRNEFERKAEGHREHGWFVELLDQTGAVVWKSPRFPELSTALDFKPTVQSRQQDDTLLAWRMIDQPGIPKYQIVLGTPAGFLQQSIRGITRSMWWIGAGLSLLAPFGGYLLAWWAVRPVRKIIETTRILQPNQLTQRLPIRGTGDELDQLSEEINAFLDEIAHYISGQREFTANAAHELRSPLTAIQTSVEVALGKERSVTQYREQLETVSEQCAQLRHLVNQLMELSETEMGQTQAAAKPFNMSELIRKSTDVFSGVAEELNVKLVCDLQPLIYLTGHENRMRQVVNNLLDNALKFTPPEGRVTISLKQDYSRVIMVVSDTGCGIPDGEKQKVFDRFYQVDAARERDTQRGNGLGLSICKAVIDLHHGTTAIQDGEPHGTRIEVSFSSQKT